MDDKKCPGDDAIYPLPTRLPDGSIPVIHHDKDHNLQMGSICELKDGQPITGDVVQLEDYQPGRWCKMKTVVTGRKGPAKVNSAAYKQGWTNIFGKQTRGQA